MRVLQFIEALPVIRQKKWQLLIGKSRALWFALLRPSCHRCQPWNTAACLWHNSQGLMHHNLTKTLSLSISKGSISYILQDLRHTKVCMRQVPKRLTFKHKITWNSISSRFLEHFEAQREILAKTITADDTWTGDKSNPWNGTILSLPKRKNSKFSVSMQGQDHCLLSLWRRGPCGCDANRENNHLQCLQQDADRTQEVFQTTWHCWVHVSPCNIYVVQQDTQCGLNE